MNYTNLEVGLRFLISRKYRAKGILREFEFIVTIYEFFDTREQESDTNKKHGRKRLEIYLCAKGKQGDWESRVRVTFKPR